MPWKPDVPEAGPMIPWTIRVTERTRTWVAAQAAKEGMSVGKYLDKAFSKRGGWNHDRQ